MFYKQGFPKVLFLGKNRSKGNRVVPFTDEEGTKRNRDGTF